MMQVSAVIAEVPRRPDIVLEHCAAFLDETQLSTNARPCYNVLRNTEKGQGKLCGIAELNYSTRYY